MRGQGSARAALRLGAGVLATALALAGGARAGEQLVLPPAGRDGWQPLELPGVKQGTTYETVVDEGVAAVRSRSRCGASALTVPLDELDLRETPVLRWRWKVEQALPPHDEHEQRGDDFSARVYVMFRIDPGSSTLQRAQNRLASRILRREVPGQALNYVRSSREPAGTRWDNPFAGTSKMISLGVGRLPEWREERVDVLADYRSLFGLEPPQPLGLAIMTDTDQTCGEAAASFADFRFTARDPEGESAPETPRSGGGGGAPDERVP